MTTVDTFLDVGQTAHVKRRVRQNAVHPWKAEQRQKTVQNADHQQIHVISTTFFESTKERDSIVLEIVKRGQMVNKKREKPAYLLHGLLTIAAAMF